MKVMLLRISARTVPYAACVVALVGCAVPEKHDAALVRVARASRVPVHFEQVSFGHGAVFAACRGLECPRVTPKTFAPVPLAAAVSIPPSSHVTLVDVAGDRPAHASEPAPSGHQARAIPIPATVDVGGVSPSSTGEASGRSLDSASSIEELVTINFAFRGVALDEKAKDAIVELIPRVRRAKRVVIAGRTDNVGGTTTNNTIALARALAVRGFMLERAPDLAPNLAIHAKGACCFVASNDSEEGRARNRRVEIVLREKS